MTPTPSALRPIDSFFKSGGTLEPNAPSYVVRQADDELYTHLQQGEFCYVLTSRQMGKSSLMGRAAARLRREEVAVAVIDLTLIGQNLSAEQWYASLLERLGQHLDLEEELEDYWLGHERQSSLQRWLGALHEVVLARCPGRVVIFVDEIDAIRSLPFSTDEFFAAVRASYNRRTEEPEFARLTFCLLGVATPSDLIQDTRTTPFNIGRRVELTDFTETEAAPLAAGLGVEAFRRSGVQDPTDRSNPSDPSEPARPNTRTPERLLRRILYWTGGHPQLTQRLCQAVAAANGSSSAQVSGRRGPTAWVPGTQNPDREADRLCERLFFSHGAAERDDNLLFVRDRLLKSADDPAGVLDLYAQVRRGQRVRDEETNQLVSLLRLSGIVRVVAGHLQVRNRIYARVFDAEWIAAHMPDAELRRQRAAFRRGVRRAAAIGGAVALTTLVLASTALYQARRATALSVTLKMQLRVQKEMTRALQLQRDEAKRQQERAQTAEQRERLRTQEAVAAREQMATARREAVTGRMQAEQQRGIAIREDRVAQQRLVRMNVMTGMHLVDEGDLFSSLPWFVEALTLDQHDAPSARNDRLRLAGVLRQCPKLIQVWSQPSTILAAALSPDAEHLAVACADGKARLYGVRNDQPIRALPHPGPVYHVAYSPDGRRVATACLDRMARVWDVASGQLLFSLPHPIWVWRVAFSPDGRRLAAGCGDGTVCVWRLDAHPATAVTMHHKNRVWDVAFSPDGRRLGTASEDGTARVWDSVTGAPVTPSLQHSWTVRRVSFSPDGQRALTASWDGTACIWDAASGRVLTRLTKHKGAVYDASFSPDGQRVVTASWDGTACVWDAGTGQPVSPPLHHNHGVSQAMFSPDGRSVLTASWDRTVRLWNPETGELVVPPLNHGDFLVQVAFSRDGSRILTASQDRTTRLWDLATLITGVPPLQHTGWVLGAEFSPDGQRVVTASDDETARVWDAATGALIGRPLWHRAAVHHARFSPDGRQVVTASDDGTARVWDARTGEFLTLPLRHRAAVHTAVFSADGRRVLTGSEDGTARVWDSRTGKPLATMKVGQAVRDAEFSPDGRRVATASGDINVAGVGEAQVWEAATGRPLLPRPIKHATCVVSASFSSDGRRLLTACSDLTLNACEARVWDAATGKPVSAPMKHVDRVRCAVFSPDQRRVATASEDNTARVWDARTGRPLTPPLNHRQQVYSIAFSPDSRRVVTASLDNTARVWDAASGEPLTPPLRHHAALWQATFSPDGTRVVTASQDHTAQVWMLPQDRHDLRSLRVLAQSLAGHAIDATGGLVPVPPGTLSAAWHVLRARYPGDFGSSAAQVAAWHRRQAIECGLDGQSNEALEHLARALEIDPRSAATYEQRAHVEELLGNRQKAVEDLTHALQWQPNNIQLYEERALNYWKLNEGVKASADARKTVADEIAGLSRLVRAGADPAEVYPQRAQLYEQLGQTQEAFADLTRAVKLRPVDPLVYLRRASYYQRANRWEEARADYTRAIDLGDDQGWVRASRGFTEAARERWKAADQDYTAAIARGASDEEIGYLSALVRLALNDTAGYRKVCAGLWDRFGTAARPIQPGRVDIGEGQLLWTCALAPDALADLTLLVSRAQAAADRSPRVAYAVRNLAALFYRAGHFREALERLNQAMALEGNGGLPQEQLLVAECLFRLGQIDAARQRLADAEQAIDQAGRPERALPARQPRFQPPWYYRLELQVLRREADRLILPAAKTDGSAQGSARPSHP